MRGGGIRVLRTIIARRAGFCFGVRRAVEAARSAAPAYTLGPVIHNPRVVAELAALGVLSADTPEAIPEGARAVVRSHGVGRDTLSRLEKRARPGLRRHLPVCGAHSRYGPRGRIGRPAADRRWRRTPSGSGRDSRLDELSKLRRGRRSRRHALPAMERALVVSQTTFIAERFESVCAAIRARVREAQVRKTICPATRDRQQEAVRWRKAPT